MKYNKEQFEKVLNKIVEVHKKQEEFIDNIDKCFPNAFEAIYEIDSLDLTLDVLEDMMDDSEQWISYFVVDQECKPFPIWVGEDKEEIIIGLKDLYDLIAREK